MASPLSWLLNGIYNLYMIFGIFTGAVRRFKIKRNLDGKMFDMVRQQAPEGPFLPVLPISPSPRPDYSKKTLPAGHQKAPRHMALKTDTVIEENVAITLRDGVRIYADIFRPADESIKCPVIVAYSPYGKHQSNTQLLESLPGRVGTKQEQNTGYEDFEGPDPGFWIPHNYAVVNVDVRGSWHSEGNHYFWGKQTEQDGYDVVEFLARLPWSNGKVGFAGNSWLAIVQWFIAAGKPPHLAAIAPWEGLSDAYRDSHRRGGIPGIMMASMIPTIVPGKGLGEDGAYMATQHALWDEYWEDKKANLKNITVPAYVVASYCSTVHVSGTIRGFRNISSTEKWLRIHSTQEWHDFGVYQDELLRFFDCYLKGIENDWKSTPRTRVSLLRFDKRPAIVNETYSDYPPKEVVHQKYYLDAATQKANLQAPREAATVRYRANTKQQVFFDIIFNKPTKLIGFPTIRVYIQCQEHDDMDVFAQLRKLGKDGQTQKHVNFPTEIPTGKLPMINVVIHEGPHGMMRASHRAVAPSNEVSPGELFHPHSREDKVNPGDIVAVEFNTWPMGIAYEAGEGVRLVLSGEHLGLPESKELPHDKNKNIGTHIIHTGDKYQSWVSLPIYSS